MEACRALGLLARFVSGYQEGDPNQNGKIHAWAEVYLPVLVGEDMTPRMMAVADRHVTLVASALPSQLLRFQANSTVEVSVRMQYHISIQPL